LKRQGRNKHRKESAWPLKKEIEEVIDENISEFHTGKTYAATKTKFGKAKADRQAIAVAMSQAGKTKKKIIQTRICIVTTLIRT
jgi:hypothetical protein